MKKLEMHNGAILDGSDHPAHHETEYRPGYGLYCRDCKEYVTTYDP